MQSVLGTLKTVSATTIAVIVGAIVLIIVSVAAKRNTPLEMTSMILMVFASAMGYFMMRMSSIDLSVKMTIVGAIVLLNEFFETLVAFFERRNWIQGSIRALLFVVVATALVTVRKKGLTSYCSSLSDAIAKQS